MTVTQQRRSHGLPPELVWLMKEIRPLPHWHLASFLCITIGSLLALLSALQLKWLIDGIIPQRRMGLVLRRGVDLPRSPRQGCPHHLGQLPDAQRFPENGAHAESETARAPRWLVLLPEIIRQLTWADGDIDVGRMMVGRGRQNED
jgi:hypothetical protein